MENIVPLKKSPRNCLAARFSISPTPPPPPLAPIGVFWDIENCQVPRGKSAGALVQLLRNRFFTNHREAEFLCVCDISKERKDVIHELNLSQITVIHINATSKNAADDKLKQCMHRFADTFGSPSTIILISGDVNFAPHLSDFRHRQHIRVILIHGNQAPEALIVCAHEHYNFSELTKSLPPKDMPKPYSATECELFVSELPRHRENSSIHSRLRQLSDNCGGRVLCVSQEGTALVRFPNPQAAQRAKKRMDKEDVFGSKISVNFPSQREHTSILSACKPNAARCRRTMSSGGSSSSRDSSPRAIHSDFEAASPRNKHFKHRPQKTPVRKRGDSPPLSKSAMASDSVMDSSAMPPPPSPFYPKTIKSPKSVGRVSPLVADLRFRPIANPPFPPPPTDYQVHWSTQEPPTTANDSSPVELLITNLDHSFETNDMKNILASLFAEHVMVLHISMVLHPAGEMKAVVKVSSPQDAQLAISQLHRRKVGSKRILISHLAAHRTTPLPLLRAEVLALLQSIPCLPLPLFKFRELFEQRYQRNLSLSDLYRMKDCISVTEGSSGRMVAINPDYRPTPSPSDMEQETGEKPYCERHFEVAGEGAWAEREPVYPLPDVHLSLKCLAARVHTLLDGHGGRLPLNSFCACYRAEFGEVPVASEGGVPLEHLLSCIPGVQVGHTPLGVKRLQWMENKEQPDGCGPRSVSPALQGPLSQFCREVVDLLKTRPGALLPFTQFIPEYHHHFGRQCRVADFGFTRLADLLESLPHVIQVLGQGSSRRVVTLSHTAQVRRFSSELSRVLRSTGRPLAVSDLPTAFTTILGRPFRLADYGVCDVEDLLADMDSSSLQVTKSAGETFLSIPKKEQTAEEAAKTQQFERDVLELLRHMPRCSMPFSRFIPSYHHHFSRQCRLADFGVAKLLDLFELIPHIVTVTGVGEEKELHLSHAEYHKVVTERVRTVLQKVGPLQLPQTYLEMFGTALRPEEVGATDLETVHTLIAPPPLPPQKQQPTPPEPPQEAKTNNSIPLSDLGEQLAGLVRTHGGQLQVAGLESAYQEMYGGPCPRLGFPSLAALLHALPPDSGLSSRGKKGRKTLVLLPDPGEKESLTATQTIPAARISAPALMDQPVPSNVPSPDLQPELPPDSDLMGFESPLPPSSEVEAVLRTLVNKTEEQRPRRPRLAAQFSVPLH